MSQAGRYTPSVVPGIYVETLTGNTGGPVSPSIDGNIFVVGDGVLTTVIGTPGTNTLEIILTGLVADEYVTDAGTAVPALGVLNITGGSTGLLFDGSGNTISLSGTLDVLNGGTGNNAFVDYAPIVGGITTTGPLQSANTGISNSGYVFTSTGATSVPTFQALPASSISITGDTGGALTGNAFTFHGGTTGLSFGGSGTTETLTFAGITANGGTVSLATDATTSTINVGTGAGAKTTTLGSLSSTSATTIQSGSGGINIPQFTQGAVVTSTAGLVSSVTGTAGYVLTANSGAAPSFQAVPSGGIVTIDGDSGSATGSTITFNANSNAGSTVKFTASSATVDLNVTDSNNNTIIGKSSGNGSISGSQNTGIGENCYNSLTSGSYNAALGQSCFVALTTGSSNCAVGQNILAACTSGIRNVGIGNNTMSGITTGSYNSAFGVQAASNYTGSESSNICIGYNTAGTVSESNVLRIGNGTGTGSGQLNSAHICGISGVNVGSVATVVTESGDQLGTAVLTAGTGISVTAGANTITIAATGGSGITTLDADSGSATGSTITFNANSNSGSTVKFTASSATVDLNVTDSNNNTIIGKSSGNGSISGSQNTGIGENCYSSLTSGSYNAALGQSCFVALTTGSSNCAVGQNILAACTSGIRNVGIGNDTMSGITTGSYNSAFGVQAASNYTGSESSNICIGYNTAGTVSESNVLRIGNGTGTGSGQLNSAHICGIQGITVTGTAVLVSSSDQLGISVSSRRYKENIQDMGNISSDILKLRPVSFNYTVGEDHSRQTGLIAEEVEEIMPALAAYNKDGVIEAVKYHELPVLLLNELQKALKRISALEAKLGVNNEQ